MNMDHMQRQDRLEWIAQLIRQGKTGTPEEFAQRCGMTVKMLLRQIDVLRQYTGRAGVKICYDRENLTYYFDKRGKFTTFEFKIDT